MYWNDTRNEILVEQRGPNSAPRDIGPFREVTVVEISIYLLHLLAKAFIQFLLVRTSANVDASTWPRTHRKFRYHFHLTNSDLAANMFKITLLFIHMIVNNYQCINAVNIVF